jgi:Na+/H+ antiporter NhaD/arsenite permease-like protein
VDRGFAVEAAAGTVLLFLALVPRVLRAVDWPLLLDPFTDDWRRLAWGVNVGGFGFAVGSLANLIALRLGREPGIWREFHRWSIPVLLLAAALGALPLP